jgi:sugar phosphate isomerase/epimerase
MPPPRRGLALHTWTLDTTPLVDVLRIARDTGWDAVELRRLDFTRAAESGESADQMIERVRESRLPVACVGVELGWMFTDGEEKRRLLAVFDEQCRRAVALGCATVMSPVDKGCGNAQQAADSVRQVGDLAARHGVRLALEFNSQAEQLNTLHSVRQVLAHAAHPACGLLLDTYHLQRSGTALREVGEIAAEEIAYVQYSDVPARGLVPGMALDRLPPGHGIVAFKDIFQRIAASGYRGYFSYEAPNPAAWKRPPDDVAREALEATRAVLR